MIDLLARLARHADRWEDEELNQMIASLQGNQHGQATPVAPAAQPSPAATAPVSGTTPANNVNPVITNQRPVANAAAQPAVTPTIGGEPSSPVATPSTVDDDLGDIRRQPIAELRPLVDKLDLPPEDKFDTLLLLIRTMDDSSLIPAAHEAAKAIADDTRRAQALLDIIKEIDFFGRK